MKTKAKAKKYEFTGRTNNGGLQQIRRLNDGRIGGWIESKANLSHAGNCWVWENAQVSGNARVSGHAQVFDKAWVSGNARVSGHAKVSQYARVSGNACIFGDARISGEALVCDKASVSGKVYISGDAAVFGTAQLFGRAKVSGNGKVGGGKWDNSPLFIQGSKHGVSNSKPGFITIGCNTHPFAKWVADYEAIGVRANYSAKQIKEYGAIIAFIVLTGKA